MKVPDISPPNLRDFALIVMGGLSSTCIDDRLSEHRREVAGTYAIEVTISDCREAYQTLILADESWRFYKSSVVEGCQKVMAESQ